MRPPSVAANGLAAALREHLAERERADNLIVTLYVEGNENLSAREAEQLFRIAQEALNNIVKHARVTRAHIALDFRAPCWMEIRDAGAGFDMDSAQDATQVGLVSMRERAAEIGWSLQIRSSPAQGTLIRVEQTSGANSQ
ncbi:MAG: Sensor histidine kinase LiaS [Anaerolineae bacterium]|nr:Sensor histidine kinase LiaS [Anaerolineae bacterium]